MIMNDYSNKFKELETSILKWALEKGILSKGTPTGQAEKTIEEAQEILNAIKVNDRVEIADGIGDTLVTLIIQSHMQNLNIIDCLEQAYSTIVNRTGKMINGVFVKDD